VNIMRRRKIIELRLLGDKIIEQGEKILKQLDLEQLDIFCINCGWCHEDNLQTDHGSYIRLSCLVAWFRRRFTKEDK